MEVDALDYIIEEVLSMECRDGKQRSVAYLSKSLNKTERNYEIYNKKILAVIRDWKTGGIYQRVQNSSSKSGHITRTQNIL